jgi:uncharacterized cupin superfamily protein
MRFTRLYTDDGQSRLEECTFNLEREGVEQMEHLMAPHALTINETDPGHQYDWHNAPQRQWVFTLSGEIEVELRDGTKQRFRAGDVILAEDTTGDGHRTRVVSAEPWRCAYVPF